MRFISVGVGVALGLFGLSSLMDSAPSTSVPARVPVVELPEAKTVQVVERHAHTIERGEPIGLLLPVFGVHEVDAVVEAARPYADLTRIRYGRDLEMVYDPGDHERPRAIRYPLSEDRTLVVHLREGGPEAEVEVLPYQHRTGIRRLSLDSTLWEAAMDAGLRPGDILRLAQVFQFELDFNTELRSGAAFELVADELYLDGEFRKLGQIHAIRLTNGDEQYQMVWYAFGLDEMQQGYYHPDGEASRASFLRSPLEFSRVTSNFNPRRFHPKLKRRRAHNGTDFGASTGTPVRAVANGKVTFAATNGGYGKHVALEHEGPFDTSYSHLSRITVKRGQSVVQGQVIGRVGSTGMSTGPHLHYELHVNGKPVNAMSYKLPRTEPLQPSELLRFEPVRDYWLGVLDGTVNLSTPAPPMPLDLNLTQGLPVADALE